MVRRLSGLDDLARIIFPDNRRHRRVFVAIWTELKYADGQFLSSFSPLCQRYGFTERVLEIVRAKLRRLGILKRVSHFNPRHGFSSGWTFSDRFAACLVKLAETARATRCRTGDSNEEQKERDSIMYV